MTHSYIEDMAYIREHLQSEISLKYAFEQLEIDINELQKRDRNSVLSDKRCVIGVIATFEQGLNNAIELTKRDRTTILHYFMRFKRALQGYDSKLLSMILKAVSFENYNTYNMRIELKAQHLKKTFGKRLALQHLEEMFNFMNDMELPTIPIKQIEDLKFKINKL